MSDPAMGDGSKSGETLGRKARNELIHYALISLYLYICFGAMLFYRMAFLHAAGVSYAPYGVAAVKALILAKFLLLGQIARLGDHYIRRRVIYVILHKSLLFLLLLFVLSEIEDAVVGMLHGQAIRTLVTELGGAALLQTLATTVIMLLILMPYIAFREIAASLGEDRLLQLLTARRDGVKHQHPRHLGAH
ncbi:MAG TPA: hypothetical protein VK726_16770 [Acetobacteraceae bacterium]|nr:hypothetical protein [Acetobacteraceae bacterium]